MFAYSDNNCVIGYCLGDGLVSKDGNHIFNETDKKNIVVIVSKDGWKRERYGNSVW